MRVEPALDKHAATWSTRALYSCTSSFSLSILDGYRAFHCRTKALLPIPAPTAPLTQQAGGAPNV
jgi:hypothetical protein